MFLMGVNHLSAEAGYRRSQGQRGRRGSIAFIVVVFACASQKVTKAVKLAGILGSTIKSQLLPSVTGRYINIKLLQ
jgi:hypothetical protein